MSHLTCSTIKPSSVPEKLAVEKPELRVLQIFSALGVGGAETWLIALLEHFERLKDVLPIRLKVDVCLTSGAKGAFDHKAALLGARLFYLPYTRRHLATFIRDFRQLLRSGHYHVIHDHQDTTSGLHFLFGIGDTPDIRIAHFHNAFECYPAGLIRKTNFFVGKKLLEYLASHVLGTSNEVLGQYGFGSSKFNHKYQGAVHCGFDTSLYKGEHQLTHNALCDEFKWEKDSKIILFVGRLEKRKNPHFAIDVAQRCMELDPRIRLIVAGGCDEQKGILIQRVKNSRFYDRICLAGVRSDIPRLMNGSDLLIFPSVAEGLGMVLAEAQASGLPVLASDTTPRECVVLPDLIFFRSLSDGPSIWAEDVLRLINSAQPDKAFCNLAVKKSKFSIDYSARHLLQLYTNMSFAPFMKCSSQKD